MTRRPHRTKGIARLPEEGRKNRDWSTGNPYAKYYRTNSHTGAPRAKLMTALSISLNNRAIPEVITNARLASIS